jgi:hypothetical protein
MTKRSRNWRYVLPAVILGFACSRRLSDNRLEVAAARTQPRTFIPEHRTRSDTHAVLWVENCRWSDAGVLAEVNYDGVPIERNEMLMRANSPGGLPLLVDAWNEVGDERICFKFGRAFQHDHRSSTGSQGTTLGFGCSSQNSGDGLDGWFQGHRWGSDTAAQLEGSEQISRLPSCDLAAGHLFGHLETADGDTMSGAPDLFSPRARNSRSGKRIQRTTTASRSIGSVKQVDVTVTGSSGGNVYLDKGRAMRIEPGDEVILYPPGQGIVNGTVQSVSTNSSRCRVVSRATAIDIGTRGAVLIPVDRLEAITREESRRSQTVLDREVPEHPPWTRPPEEWNEEAPLLAPAYSREIWERETEIYGRVFAQYLHTWNRKTPDNQYSLGRIGTSLWIENPVGRGGGLHVDGELNRRGIFVDDARDEIDQPGRLDRLSYFWGGTQDQPVRYELGRFLHHEFPEFGFLDGAEFVYRTKSGNRVGFSLGALPEPFPDMKTGDDLGVTVFYRFIADEEENFSVGIGYQKTWHRGRADRDLLVGAVDYHPNPVMSVHGTIWGDFYGPEDTIKSTSFEITEAVLQATMLIGPGRGVAVYLSEVRWPELLRREFSPFVEEQVRRSGVNRYGLRAWQELGERVRLDGRVDLWRDRDEQDGVPWEVTCSVRDFFYDHGEVALSFFETQGIYTSGPGARVSMNRYLPWCFASVSYELAGYEFGQDSLRFWQQSVRANLDFNLQSRKSVSLFTDYRFGDHQNAVHMGLFFQKRL